MGNRSRTAWKVAQQPGRSLNLPPPQAGETLGLSIDGLPPYKERRFSIRSPRHKDHRRFLALREVGTWAMAGPAWVTGPVRLAIRVFSPCLERDLIEYVGGVMDTQKTPSRAAGSSKHDTAGRHGRLSWSRTRIGSCWSSSPRTRSGSEGHEELVPGGHVSARSSPGGLPLPSTGGRATRAIGRRERHAAW